MKRWMTALVSITAVAGVTALALFLAGAFDDDSADRGADGSEVAAVCAEDQPDCDDTIVVTDDIADDGDGDGASIAPVCAPGFPDCVETVVQDDEAGDAIDSDGDGATSASFCAPPPGFPDYCVDTIVHGDDTGDVDDNGEGGVTIAPLCNPDFPDCEDMIVVDVDGGDGDSVPSIEPVSSIDEVCTSDAITSCEQQATNAVLADAERLFGVDESAIDVESAAFQEWTNSCLNAAAEGELCVQVMTPGFVIVLTIEDSSYEYHTDLRGNVRLAI